MENKTPGLTKLIVIFEPLLLVVSLIAFYFFRGRMVLPGSLSWLWIALIIFFSASFLFFLVVFVIALLKKSLRATYWNPVFFISCIVFIVIALLMFMIPTLWPTLIIFYSVSFLFFLVVFVFTLLNKSLRATYGNPVFFISCIVFIVIAFLMITVPIVMEIVNDEEEGGPGTPYIIICDNEYLGRIKKIEDNKVYFMVDKEEKKGSHFIFEDVEDYQVIFDIDTHDSLIVESVYFWNACAWEFFYSAGELEFLVGKYLKLNKFMVDENSPTGKRYKVLRFQPMSFFKLLILPLFF